MTAKLDIYEDDIETMTQYLEVSSIVAEHNKDHIAKTIIENGDSFLAEIDKRNKLREIEKEKYIKKILKSHKDKYTFEELKSYSLKDVREIFDMVDEENKTFIKKVFKFFG